MAWFEELGEQARKRWLDRVARERQKISASVEETLKENALHQNQGLDEDEEDDEVMQSADDSVHFPPRLSLQSKAMPVVRAGIHEGSSFSGVEDSYGISGVPDASSVHPVARKRVGHLVPIKPSLAPVMTPPARPTEMSPSKQSKPRLGGTTKVHLQTVRKADLQLKPVEPIKPLNDVSMVTSSRLPAVERGDSSVLPSTREKLAGSGIVESGQSEVAVSNTHITASSVVMVMLTANPGPVVVQYVSLQPKVGFTLHLSGPARSHTPFNYVILMGEVF